MANILVYIELDEQQISGDSLRALCTGRSIATGMGATLHAVLPCEQTPRFYGDEDLVAALSKRGADKVVLATNTPRGPALYATHGAAVIAVCERFPPLLVLFPARAGHDIAPRVAFHLQAVYCPNAEIAVAPLDPSADADEGDGAGELFVYRQRVFRRRYLWQEPVQRHRPVVLTLAPGQRDLSNDSDDELLGEDEAEVVVVQTPRASTPSVTFTSGATAAIRPQLVLGGGAGLGDSKTFARVGALARRLDAKAAATRTACDRGLADRALQVGMDADPIPGDVYLALGVSGSDDHLTALDPQTTVVAVNSDPDAPIFDVVRCGLVADARQVLSSLEGTAENPGDAREEPEERQP